MMQRKRPVLSPGDVCKIARKFQRRFKRNSSVVVIKVYGDGTDRDSTIECSVSLPSRFGRGGFKKPYKHKFRREQLWFTGYNIHKGETNKSRVGPSVAIQNPTHRNNIQCRQCGVNLNSGEKCYWCETQN